MTTQLKFLQAGTAPRYDFALATTDINDPAPRMAVSLNSNSNWYGNELYSLGGSTLWQAAQAKDTAGNAAAYTDAANKALAWADDPRVSVEPVGRFGLALVASVRNTSVVVNL